MPNIKYIISSINTSGKSEILVRFYAGKINQQAHSGVFVPRSLWSDEQQRCIVSRRYESPENAQGRKAQKALDDLSDYIFDAYQSDKVQGIATEWLRSVVARFHNVGKPTDPPIAEMIDDYCNARNVEIATRKKMLTLRTHIHNYDAFTGAPLRVSTLSVADIQGFANYLLNGLDGHGRRSQNSVTGRIRQLRTIVYWYGKPSPNPFDNYTIPAEVYGTPIYLTQEERTYLYKYNDLPPAKAVQRDIFIFQCHTGCRMGDLFRLTPANITPDGWLAYSPAKTKNYNPETIEVPLSPVALEIVQRYKGVCGGRLLPFISEQKYNAAIKEICKAANLDRNVIIIDPITRQSKAVPLWSVCTSHTARKTFAQAVYSSTGDKRLTASLTGHSENSQAFNRYSEVSRDMKKGAISVSASFCEIGGRDSRKGSTKIVEDDGENQP